MNANLTPARRSGKPAKPYADFPLYAHATGRWAKKIRGKLHYFGPWDDPQGALQCYLEQRDDLHAGRMPRVQGDGFAIRDLCNQFLTSKLRLLENDELTQRTFDDYKSTCDRIVATFGKTRLVSDLAAADFEKLRAELAKGWGPVTLGNEVQRVRVVFKYAYDAELIDRPVRFGPNFKRPSQRVLRRARNEKGPRMFEADELRTILAAAKEPLRTMVLLGVNCAFGNHDVGTLPRKAVDLKRGWIDYPRPKTGIARRAPLWSETVAAIDGILRTRREPKDAAHNQLVFITKYGGSWVKENSDRTISKEMTKLLKTLGLHRPGLGFYSLRHTFETVGGETIDQVAVDHIMGHVRHDMASVYRERISDERLTAVTNYIHDWLLSAIGSQSLSRGSKRWRRHKITP